MIFDLSDAVLDCSQEYEIVRHESANIDYGRKSSPVVKKIKIQASVSPMRGRTLDRDEAGLISGGDLLVITSCKLYTANTSPCRMPDILMFNDDKYQISKVKDWSHLGNFYECIADRMSS